MKTRYADFGEVMDYCRRSANPVGQAAAALVSRNRAARTGLLGRHLLEPAIDQLLQDIEIDFRKDRIYLPADEMAKYGVTEAQIAKARCRRALASTDACSRSNARADAACRAHRSAGGSLGRIGLELRMIVMGGNRILEKLQASRGDVFRHRPVLQHRRLGNHAVPIVSRLP